MFSKAIPPSLIGLVVSAIVAVTLKLPVRANYRMILLIFHLVTSTDTCRHTYAHTHVDIIYLYTRRNIPTNMHTYICTNKYIQSNVHTQIICTHTQTHIYTQTNTHTHSDTYPELLNFKVFLLEGPEHLYYVCLSVCVCLSVTPAVSGLKN